MWDLGRISYLYRIQIWSNSIGPQSYYILLFESALELVEKSLKRSNPKGKPIGRR